MKKPPDPPVRMPEPDWLGLNLVVSNGRLPAPPQREPDGRVPSPGLIAERARLSKPAQMPEAGHFTPPAEPRPLAIEAEGSGPYAGQPLDRGAAAAIIESMMNGHMLSDITTQAQMPRMLTVRRWRRESPEFDALMREAEEMLADRFAALSVKKVNEVEKPELAVKGLQWVAERMNRAKWGAGDGGVAVSVNLTMDDVAKARRVRPVIDLEVE